ncbi:MAG: sialidase family protein [Bacteroidota bacterium]
MKQLLVPLFLLCSIISWGQGVGQGFTPSLTGEVDSTRLNQDSILVYFRGGIEVGRDTLAVGVGPQESLEDGPNIPLDTETFYESPEVSPSNVPADDYIMMPNVSVDPTTDYVWNCFGKYSSHSDKEQGFTLRRSTDQGRTWTGITGTGDFTDITTTDFGQNWRLSITNTGRFLVIYQYAVNASSGRSEQRVIYSDDDGATWSAPYTMQPPTGVANIVGNPLSWSDIVYNDVGELLLPYFVRIGSIGHVAIGIASSNDDGATWDLNYSIAYTNPTGSDVELIEAAITDLGEGVMAMVCRMEFGTNAAGDQVPALMMSTDYGRNWAGSSQTLSLADIEAGNHASGWLYLEGPGISMGSGLNFNGTLPQVNMSKIGGVKYMVIDFWTRVNELGEQEVWKSTIIDPRIIFREGLSAAIVTGEKGGVSLPYLINDYPDNLGPNFNGGNGNSVIFNNELILTNYQQDVIGSDTESDIAYAYIDRGIFRQMAYIYENVGEKPLVSFSARSNGTAQNVAPDVWVKITNFEEEWDIGSGYDPVAGRYTPSRAGYYLIQAGLVASIEDGSQMLVALRKNNVLYRMIGRGANGTTTLGGYSGGTIVYLNGTTDFIEIYTLHRNTSSTDYVGNEGYQHFSAYWIGL